MMCRAPASNRIFVTATPAAPRPTITIRRSPIARPVSRNEFNNAASTTTAVPC